ncbi:MAG: exopolysaccharide biosynthesis protein [Pseudomonadota bacterium]
MTKVNNLSSLMRSLVEETDGEVITARDMLNAVGRRSYGPLLLLLGFIAISPLTIIPGATWLVSLLILVISGQILIGMRYPWVPGRLLKFEFRREDLLKGVEMSQGYVRRIDAVLRPRLTFLTDPPFAQLIALVCIAAALISFPLGFIPFGPVLPGLAVLLFGLGLTARDGFVLVAAGLSLAGAVLLLIRLWGRISGALGLG